MKQKKFEAPEHIRMEDGLSIAARVDEASQPSVEDVAETKRRLEAAIAAFNDYKKDIKDAIRIASDSIDTLEDLAKAAVGAVGAVESCLFENSIDALVTNKATRDTLIENIEDCTYFMQQYIAVLEQQSAALEQKVPAGNLPIQHPDFMDSAFVNKAIGVASMVLGALSTLLGALAMVVSMGLISTVVLAPVGVIGANAGAGMVSGGLFALAFGGGFFGHGRNLAKAEAARVQESTVVPSVTR